MRPAAIPLIERWAEQAGPATTKDQGVPLCDECAQYVLDEDGEYRCSRTTDGEELADGTWRPNPPPEPAETPDGEWACFWATVGGDEGPAGRYATRAEAARAVEAKDWPHPDDHTQYLCGYEVRRLVDGEWVLPDEDDDLDG